MKKIFAFTLAETLIVMGVIGIVSALTLPNLNSSTGDKERVAKVKKIYQNLNDALGRAEAVYGPYSDWFINDANSTAKAKRASERITEFMKISKICGTATGCFKNGFVGKLNGTASVSDFDNDTTGIYKFITADETSVAIINGSGDDEGYNWKVQVDIDGPAKGPHVAGKDIFRFNLDEAGTLSPTGNEKTFDSLLSNLKSGGRYASAWIIKYDNADYLQFQSVSGSTATCKNGNTVTEANPRCK